VTRRPVRHDSLSGMHVHSMHTSEHPTLPLRVIHPPRTLCSSALHDMNEVLAGLCGLGLTGEADDCCSCAGNTLLGQSGTRWGPRLHDARQHQYLLLHHLVSQLRVNTIVHS
jgi:hypothetical protein